MAVGLAARRGRVTSFLSTYQSSIGRHFMLASWHLHIPPPESVRPSLPICPLILRICWCVWQRRIPRDDNPLMGGA